MTLKEISAGFKILPIQIPHSAQINRPEKDRPETHELLFKRHQVRKESTDLPPERTLFLTQLPLCTSTRALKSNLQHVFKKYGKIERIALTAPQKTAVYQNQLDNERSADLLSPGTFCYLVFEDEESVEKILDEMKVGKRGVTWSSEASSGMKRWKQKYFNCRPDRDELKERIEAEIEAFDQQEAAKEEELKARLNQPDEDGWVTVGRVGRKNRNTDGKTTVTAAKAEDLQQLKPKATLVPDFYRFQMRQEKKQKLMELRQKFEEDKKRLASMKANRRFKPY